MGPNDEVAGEFNLTTLDTLFADAMDALEGRVGAMKIDVEGFEPQVSERCLLGLRVCGESAWRVHERVGSCRVPV